MPKQRHCKLKSRRRAQGRRKKRSREQQQQLIVDVPEHKSKLTRINRPKKNVMMAMKSTGDDDGMSAERTRIRAAEVSLSTSCISSTCRGNSLRDTPRPCHVTPTAEPTTEDESTAIAAEQHTPGESTDQLLGPNATTPPSETTTSSPPLVAPQRHKADCHPPLLKPQLLWEEGGHHHSTVDDADE